MKYLIELFMAWVNAGVKCDVCGEKGELWLVKGNTVSLCKKHGEEAIKG